MRYDRVCLWGLAGKSVVRGAHCMVVSGRCVQLAAAFASKSTQSRPAIGAQGPGVLRHLLFGCVLFCLKSYKIRFFFRSALSGRLQHKHI
jgi:hypothetical protein